jgi:hypothetical protein
MFPWQTAHLQPPDLLLLWLLLDHWALPHHHHHLLLLLQLRSHLLLPLETAVAAAAVGCN